MDCVVEQYGYDAHFVDVVQDYLKCNVCRLVMRDPVQAMQCGHRFCKTCFDRLHGYSKHLDSTLTCPIDRKTIDINQVLKDTGVTKAINSLQVSCSRKCSWLGELFDLQQHESKCQHEPPDSVFNSLEIKENDILLKKLVQRIQKCEYSLIEKDNNINNIKCELDKMKLTTEENVGEINTLKKINNDLQTELKGMKKINEKRIDEVMKKNEQMNSGLIDYLSERIEGNLSHELSRIFHEELDRKFDNSCKLLHSEILKVKNEQKEALDQMNEFQNTAKHCLNNKENEIKLLTKNVENCSKFIDKNVTSLSLQVANLEKIAFCYDSWLDERIDLQFKWVLSDYDYYFERGTEVQSPMFFTQLQGYTFNIFVKWSGAKKEHFGLFVNVDRRLVVKDVVNGTFRFELLHRFGKRKGKEFSIANQKEFMMPPDQQIAKMTFGFSKFLTMDELQDYIINDKLFISCSYFS